MVWVLDGSIWQEGDWYVSHCKDLEIASQGKTVQEARENLGEAIRLFFEVASYTEIMEYLSRLDPIPPSEIQGQPEIRVMPAHHDSQKVKCEVALKYAWTQTLGQHARFAEFFHSLGLSKLGKAVAIS